MTKQVKNIILLFLLILPVFSYCQNKKTVTLFYSLHCKVCFRIKDEILPRIKEKYKDKIEWEEVETSSNPEGLKRLVELGNEFGVNEALTPSILVGSTLLIGLEPIKNRTEIEIDNYLSARETAFNFSKVNLIDVYKRFSVFAVMGSGLVDGINPCAFAVIVFFMSFLAVYGYQRRELVYVGGAYCLAVFVTYVLIGLGLFNFLYSFRHMYLLNKVFYYFTASFCGIMGFLALYDYFKFKSTGSGKDAILQLPRFLKKRINIVIGSRMRTKKRGSISRLIMTSFVVGFLVSLLEVACTGQIYLPTIVFILKNTDLKIKAVFYLFLYNVMFIFPLIIIFLLSLLGVSSVKFNDFLKKNVGKIKILMALVFFILGGFILWLN